MQAQSASTPEPAPRSLIRERSAARVLGVALVLGWSVDALFYGRGLGLSFPVFSLLLMTALIGLGRLEGVAPVRRNLWLLLPLLFFAGMVFVRASGFLTFLNVVASLGLMGLIAVFYAGDRIAALPLIGYPLAVAYSVIASLARTPSLVLTGLDLRVVRVRSGRNTASVARGLILALPVVLVLAVLLASADLIFARWLEDVLRLKYLADLLEYLWRGTIVLAAAWLLAGGLALALWRRSSPGSGRTRNGAEGEAGAGGEDGTNAGVGFVTALTDGLARVVSLGFIEAATILLAVDLLFLVFVWIQFTYLFGGEANISAAGFTYAEYARRGFFELVAVAVLTLGLVLGLHAITRRATTARGRAFNVLATLMAGLVIVLLASALKRLLLYEAAYGYTQLRLYSHVFMLWLGAAFVWFAAVL